MMSLYFCMKGTMVRQCFSTANEKATVTETNPQIDSELTTHITPVTSLHTTYMQHIYTQKLLITLRIYLCCLLNTSGQ